MSIDISRKKRKAGVLRSYVVYRRESLANALGISSEGVGKLIDQGLPCVTLLGRQFFPGRLVVEWFESKVS